MFQTITSSSYLTYTDPAGSPLWVLLLASAQPLHLKCLGFLFNLFLILFLIPTLIFLLSITVLLS